MEKRERLWRVERRAYQSTFKDGFYELLCGGIFILFAWIPVLESIGISWFYSCLSVLFLILIPWLGKRFVTIPRLGVVEFGEPRKARRRYTALIGAGAVILMIPLATMLFVKGFPGGLTWSSVALLAGPLIVIFVLLMDFTRMYAYAALFFFSALASEFLIPYVNEPGNSLLAFGVPGVAITVFGFILLLRFLREYPKPMMEASNVGQ